jgi:hypothetical protein
MSLWCPSQLYPSQCHGQPIALNYSDFKTLGTEKATLALTFCQNTTVKAEGNWDKNCLLMGACQTYGL